MRYRQLGSTGVNVSVVGIGAWQFGGEWAKCFTVGEVQTILGCAHELGINLVDTAECYGDHVSEAMLGAALGARRNDWYIATKFGHRYLRDGSRRAEWSPTSVLRQLHRSLRALNTDHIDLYQFHSGDDAAFDNDQLWEVLRAQQQAGKIRHLGVSIGDNRSALQTRAATTVGAEVIQVRYSRIDREADEAVLPACEDHNLGVFAREPLAAGLLTGKYPPGTRFMDPSDTRSHRDPTELERRLIEAQAVLATEVPDGVDPAAWSLAWILRNPVVTGVIPGCKSVDQVLSNAASVDLLPPERG